MQSVSSDWVENQEQNFVSESYAEISMKVADPEASEDAVPTDNGDVYFSDTENVVKDAVKSAKKLATLEMNIWSLDGNCNLLNASSPYGQNGYVGDGVGDDDGYYATAPTLTITFPSLVASAIPGITIVWGENYDEYADSFTITIKNGDTVVLTKTVTGNTDVRTEITDEVSNYNSIVIEVTRWCLPNRRARIKEVTIGIYKVFEKTDIMSIENSFIADPLSASLPMSEIKFVLKNLNGEYNSENPSGVAKYIMERQRVMVRYGYMINGLKEWINGGLYYLAEWDMPQNGITATFTARDALEYMQDIYTGVLGGKTLYEIAVDAFTQAGMPTLEIGVDRWVIDNSLQSITAPNGAYAENASIATILQYVANAGCCVFYQDRDGVLHIEPLDDTPTDYIINEFVSYENASTQFLKQIKGVTISNGDNDYTYTYATVGDIQQVQNPLISQSRAPTVAAWVYNNLVNRKIMSGSFRADPRLDALDVVEVETPYTNNDCVITEITYSFNGAFHGSYSGRCV